ncbi:MAG: hypothetical protein ABS944_10015 [Solibacillus sp.]
MTIPVTKVTPIPNGGEIHGGRDEEGYDIERWENDGGSSINNDRVMI